MPKLTVNGETEAVIGIWGQRYRKYLKTNHRILYDNYLTSGTLNKHLEEVDQRANEMFHRLVIELSNKEKVTEKLKDENPTKWIKRTNNSRSCAREIVNAEVIFI